MEVGISAAGTFRTEDGGEHSTALDREARAGFLPPTLPEVGQCVHRAALDPAGSATLYRQHRRGIYVSHDRAERWRRIGRGLPDRFGAVVAGAPALPGVAFFGR
jgi:hypothetical protein